MPAVTACWCGTRPLQRFSCSPPPAKNERSSLLGLGVGGLSTGTAAPVYAAPPPTPTPPRHAQGRVEGGEITVHDFAISPQVLREVCSLVRLPLKKRAQGMPGARCAR